MAFLLAEWSLTPATGMEFGVEYASVVVFGEAVTVIDEDEARMGLQLILDRYFPHMQAGQDYREITSDELDITAVYRIDIQALSGKEAHKPADFPGAFNYPYQAKP
jgi:nitroimidazol reductase NimA-like FMN-containing flavoprotein (pyridoxamine 5'-phosphate oxidase superfamily)